MFSALIVLHTAVFYFILFSSKFGNVPMCIVNKYIYISQIYALCLDNTLLRQEIISTWMYTWYRINTFARESQLCSVNFGDFLETMRILPIAWNRKVERFLVVGKFRYKKIIFLTGTYTNSLLTWYSIYDLLIYDYEWEQGSGRTRNGIKRLWSNIFEWLRSFTVMWGLCSQIRSNRTATKENSQIRSNQFVCNCMGAIA